MNNLDENVVDDFGREWSAYDQSEVSDAEMEAAFEQYFHVFPFERLGADSAGFDMGCGSGRWARLVAPRVGRLTCIDASEQALAVARRNLAGLANVSFVHASVDAAALEPGSQDFGYCLGVLHHIPDTLAGLKSCAALLRPGAPFLLYLYYDFENRSAAFRALWRASDLLRRAVCRLPFALKLPVTLTIAAAVYLPLARIAWLAERLGLGVAQLPLSDYRHKSFYFMRTDALDRFGTRLERRFSRAEIAAMLAEAGFESVRFSDGVPHWVCLAYRR